jgi:hypothetical protein
MYIDLHIKYPLFLSDFNEAFEESSNIKSYEKPFSGCRAVTREQDRHHEAIFAIY